MIQTDEGDRKSDREAINRALDDVCRGELGCCPARIGDAIRYALDGGGKRVRGRLLLAAFRAARGTGDATRLAAAVEIVHAYSLVHDDLPCMDDDDVRRGRPSVHRAFDVRTATFAGVLMIPLAVNVARSGATDVGLVAAETVALLERLCHASGAEGMVGGQVRDLEAEGQPITLETLESIHRAKTGALIEASVSVGALAARADLRVVSAIESFGADLGLAFQVIDDVLDVTATPEELGKASRRDAVKGKTTFPGLLGVDGARARATSLVERACLALSEAGIATTELAGIARSVVSRRS